MFLIASADDNPQNSKKSVGRASLQIEEDEDLFSI